MQKILPIYYSDYGRYINRFRAIPYYIDCLKPVERRVLLTLHETAKGPGFVKAAKVVGNCMANYHPHGDASLYKSLVQLVHQGYAIGKGNWGAMGLHDDKPAAQRYTEVKINPWVENMIFEYIDHVPWIDIEYLPEPLYLPSPVPAGLIGDGIITGITFSRTLIPKYKLKDLVERLIWMLEDNTGKGPCIVPNFKGCSVNENNIENQYYNILTNGVGTLYSIPSGDIQKKYIRILGRSPDMTFASNKENKKEKIRRSYLVDDADDKDKLDLVLKDFTEKNNIEIWIEPRKRNTNLNELANLIWSKYLIKKFNFNCIVCDNEGMVNTVGIDNILSINYEGWKYAALLKRINDYNKLNNRRFDYIIVQIIRNIFEEIKATSLDQILRKFNEYRQKAGGKILIELEVYSTEKGWTKENKEITEKEISEICSKRTIKNLVETVIDTRKVDLELLSTKNSINNINSDCLKYLKTLK